MKKFILLVFAVTLFPLMGMAGEGVGSNPGGEPPVTATSAKMVNVVVKNLHYEWKHFNAFNLDLYSADNQRLIPNEGFYLYYNESKSFNFYLSPGKYYVTVYAEMHSVIIDVDFEVRNGGTIYIDFMGNEFDCDTDIVL